ncbi:DUF4062 domain-containing protein [Mesorhizobium sp. WSM4976]|uniref:DUF4062 domain-containing protein n=1 Tax=Mesorhizobium sp. WSM4976 TaxID=3038549 RepID=UPI002416C040|nr:DUF4062 domain-containing protein [Mesorhizobium sp. WSM4976]MDG4895813.1 DUF4062 domain-containing protein [Mesorhizobium sp. WSM4976]
MTEKQKIIRVFIGSPGGLQDERQTAHDIVASVNRNHSDHWGLQFKLLGWEDVVPGYVRPQSKINDDLDKCDYFIGVLWDRWGSNPNPDGSGYTSGFEEEFYRASRRVELGQMKDMVLYFKQVPIPAGLEPGEGLRRVLEFRQKCIEEKRIFFKDFTDANAFGAVVRDKLEEIGWRETDIHIAEAEDVNQPNRTPTGDEQPSSKTINEDGLLDVDAREFLADLMNRPPDWEKTLPHEVARLRLIGTAVARSGNDEEYLGNHDANLIFQKYRDSPLSRQEVRALIDCGIVGFSHQNVPLWHWLSKNDDTWERVNFLAAIGGDAERPRAIELLSIGARPIPSINDVLDKRYILKLWLGDEASGSTFDAAASYIALKPDDEDLDLIEEVAAGCSPHRSEKVERAIVSLLSRTDANGALLKIVQKNLNEIDSAVADQLFRHPPSLSTERLLPCLTTKADTVRLRAARVLSERNEITLTVAETLLTDSNHEIRLLAAEILNKVDKNFSDEVARKALRIVRPSSGMSIFSRAETTDDTYYNIYKLNRLMHLDFDELTDRYVAAGIFCELELKARYTKYARKVSAELRDNLRDGFARFFEGRMQNAKISGLMDADSEQKIRGLETFLRKKWCDAAITPLCALAKEGDLDLIRKALNENELEESPAILSYLARFGNWSDIELIVKLGDIHRSSLSLLMIPRSDLADEKALAILALGSNRSVDMLDLAIDSNIRISLARRIPSKAIAELDDSIILRELERDVDRYRSVFAQRCVIALPRSRVTALMNRYVGSGEHRYYNSVHWLDLGASLPAKVARQVAQRALH